MPMDWDDVLRLAERLPDIEASTSYGTPAIKCRKKLVCRMWGPREQARDGVDCGVVMVRTTVEAKASLLAGSDGVVFDSPHYQGHNAIAVNLDEVSEALLDELLEQSYRIVAPKTLVKKLDG